MTELKIKGDVEQLVQATTVHINDTQNTEPLSDLQWREIRKQVDKLVAYRLAKPWEIYQHLQRIFAVEKSRNIPANRYQDALAEIQNFVDARLLRNRCNQLMSQLVNLPKAVCEAAEQYAKQTYGTSTFRLLTVQQLEDVWARFENYKLPLKNMLVDVTGDSPNRDSTDGGSHLETKQTLQEHDKRALHLALALTGLAVSAAVWVVLSGYF